jgi:hypothetical protein
MGTAEYIGSMEDGIRSGKGKLTWKDGSFYEGEFHNGLRHGFGLYQLAPPIRSTKEKKGMQARSYEGEWRNGQRYGKGKEIWPNGDILVGSFKYGKAHGMCTLVTRSGRYEGQFMDGMRSGQGSFEWHNGAIYEGEWALNRMSGFGKYVSSDNRIYEGEWVNGVREGTGAEITNEERYDGEWKDGKRNGEGQIRWPNGRWRGGLWKNGDFIKWTTTERIGGKRKSSPNKKK